MSIELPKDAEGREIPFDTEVLYDRYGYKNNVQAFAYFIRMNSWRVKFMSRTSYFATSDMYLDEPDSWEKLDEDLHAAVECEDSPNCDDPACAYARNIGKRCVECKLYEGDCTVNMCTDIARRINKLRSDDK